MDLITKIFNNLSAVADNDTKMVADGIENTMRLGLEIVFGFFMTSLGLGGVVNIRRLSPILRMPRTEVFRKNALAQRNPSAGQAFFGSGITREMVGRYMTFASWSYKKVGERWRRDGYEPVSRLVTENEFPNWQTTVILSSGTVNQEDLLPMAGYSTPKGSVMLDNKAQRSIIHQILTRHNYATLKDFGNRIDGFRLRVYGSEENKARPNSLPEYNLEPEDFINLPEALGQLIKSKRISIK